MSQKPVVFVTSSTAKVKQLAKYLKYPIVHRKLDINEIQSLEPEKVAVEKAKQAWQQINQPVIVEDISVRFSALDKLPGPFFKAFLSELGVNGICKLLDNYNTREAVVEVVYVYFDGKMSRVFSAKQTGEIAKRPRGKAIFGSDTIFIPKGYSKTWSEMTTEELSATSVTIKALDKLRKFLEARSF